MESYLTFPQFLSTAATRMIATALKSKSKGKSKGKSKSKSKSKSKEHS